MAVSKVNAKERVSQFEEYLNETFQLRKKYIPEDDPAAYSKAMEAAPPVTPPEPQTPDLSRLFGLAAQTGRNETPGRGKAGKFIMNWLTTIDPEIAAQQKERQAHRDQIQRDRFREAIDIVGAQFNNAQLKNSYELEKARITNAGRAEQREFLMKIADSKKRDRLQDWITAQAFFNKDVSNAAAVERWGTPRGGGKGSSVGRTTKLWDQDHGKGGMFMVTPQPPQNMKEAQQQMIFPGKFESRPLDPSNTTDAAVLKDRIFGPKIKSRIMDSGADPQSYFEMLQGDYPNILGDTTFNQWWGPRDLPAADDGGEPFKYKQEDIPSGKGLTDDEFIRQTIKITGSKLDTAVWYVVKMLAGGDFEEALKLMDQSTVQTFFKKQGLSPFEGIKRLMDMIDEEYTASEEGGPGAQ